MDRYMIETPHTAEECLDLITVLNAQGYLWHFDWGCRAGVTADGPSLRRKMTRRPGWRYRRWCAVGHASLS